MSIQNQTLDTLHSRRSCRAYTAAQISDAELQTVIDAGTWAATGHGSQSPVIVAVQNKAVRDKLSAINAEIMGVKIDPFYGAPTVLVVFKDKTAHTGHEDACLVLGNMMLAASSIGLGNCWIHRAAETFETETGKALLKEWGLDPEKYAGVGNCVLGYAAPGGTREPAPRKADYAIHIK